MGPPSRRSLSNMKGEILAILTAILVGGSHCERNGFAVSPEAALEMAQRILAAADVAADVEAAKLAAAHMATLQAANATAGPVPVNAADNLRFSGPQAVADFNAKQEG